MLWQLRRAGTLRFGALLRAVPGISSKVLTQRLRMLEAHGIVQRHRAPTSPPEVSYRLSARGAELEQVFDALEALSRRWLEQDAAQAPPAPRPRLVAVVSSPAALPRGARREEEHGVVADAHERPSAGGRPRRAGMPG